MGEKPHGVKLHGLKDVFERPFTDPDDPRLQCARVLTRSESEAILEYRGDVAAALAAYPVIQTLGGPNLADLARIILSIMYPTNDLPLWAETRAQAAAVVVKSMFDPLATPTPKDKA